MINHVYFYCPSKKIGGEQQLYIRCAKFLVAHTDAHVYYIDYPDGYANSQLDNNVKRVDSRNVYNYCFPPDSLLIIALSYIDGFLDIFKEATFSPGFRVLFWSLQPSNLTGKVLIRNKFNFMLPRQKKNFRESISSLCESGVIRIMDYNNYYTLKKVFGLELHNIDYLPVPIDDDFIRPEKNINYHKVGGEMLSFMWLSRIDHDKKHTLMTIINELDEANKTVPCKLIVVGDGNALDEVQNFATAKALKIDFVGRCFGDALNTLIDERVDVGVGMGTSGLEIAKRGKPVIMKMVMPKTLPFGQVKDYIFLHQEYGFSLGSPDFYFKGQSDFMTKIKELQSDYQQLAQADYLYTKQNHSIESTGRLLIDVMKQRGMSSGDMNEIRHLTMLINRYRRLTLRKN